MFHLVITFHCRVNMVFEKVVFVTIRKFELPKMDVKNEQRNAIKFCYQLKKSAAETVKLMHVAHTDEEWLGDSTIFRWRKKFSKDRETTALLPHVRQPLNICIKEMVNSGHSCSLGRLSYHCSTTCASYEYLKIVFPHDSVQEVENAENHILLGSSFPDSRRERPPYWDLLRVAVKSWKWAGYAGIHDYRWWELDSPLWSSHKTGKHALKVPAVSSKEKSPSGEIDE